MVADVGADMVRLDREAVATVEIMEALLPGRRGAAGTRAATGLVVSAV
jgi:hypothetical protein